MKLKTNYDNETDIPTGYAELFSEKNGKWMLTGIEGMKTDADIVALQTVVAKERKAHQEAVAKLKKFEKLGDADPDELLALRDEIEELRSAVDSPGKNGPSEEMIQKRIDGAVARASNPLKRKIEELTAESVSSKKIAEDFSTRHTTSTIRSALTAAAAESKILGTAIEDVLLHQHVFELVDDPTVPGKQRVVTRADQGVAAGLDAASWLSGDMRQKRPHWWPESLGAGARGGNGTNAGAANPFAKGSFNLSAVGKLMSTDRLKAEALARQAGFATPELAIDAAASR